MDETMVCRLLAALNERLGEVEGAKPKLTIVRNNPARDPARDRPPIFVLGPLQARKHSANG
jgi:hypothetical protein